MDDTLQADAALTVCGGLLLLLMRAATELALCSAYHPVLHQRMAAADLTENNLCIFNTCKTLQPCECSGMLKM
jgi:hypothetical protein